MQPDKVLQSLSNQEIAGVLEALPKELADRGIELPATLGGTTLGATAEVKPVEQSTDVFNALTPEQQEKATKLTSAMAEKFGVDEKDFSVLETESGTRAVVYTAGNGVDLGDPTKTFDKKRSWNSIFDKKNSKNFTVEVNGETVDTRTGMTRDVYEVMVGAAKAIGGEFLPDSPQLSESNDNDQPWTLTLLTGEPEKAGEINAPIAYVYEDGPVDERLYRHGSVRDDVRFRPAVVIE